MKAEYRILRENLPKGKCRVITISDLHVGNPDTRYACCWDSMLAEVRKGDVDLVIINGDLTDRIPFATPGLSIPACEDRLIHEQRLRNMLQELMDADAGARRKTRSPLRTKVVVMLGNHDRSEDYQALLADVGRQYGDRFQWGHLLLLGEDSLVAHGDFVTPLPLKPDELADMQRLVKRNQAERGSTHISREHGLKEMYDALLATFGPYLENRSHIYFGHVHPLTHFVEEMYDGRHIHITGAAMSYSPGFVLATDFTDGRVKKLHSIFEEVRDESGLRGDGTPRWTQRARMPGVASRFA